MCFGFHSQRQLCSGACSWSEGRQDPPATMLHLSPCLQVTALMYLNRSGQKFSIVDPKEWLVDKVDILRVLAQPSLDNRDGYDFGELDI